MANTINGEEAERRILGRALAALRDRAGMTQQEAAHAIDISTQAWQMYEAGKRRFTEDQIDRVSGAVGASPEELMLQRARLLGQDAPLGGGGLSEREGRAFEIPVWGRSKLNAGGPRVEAATTAEGVLDLRGLRSSAVGATRIADETMTPWGEPGETVIFDRDRWPKRGAGCVIETQDGGLLVKLYERSDETHVFVRQFNPDRSEPLLLTQIKGVYAIRLRGD